MTAVMQTKLIKIGNSHGIRIPKPVLEQLNLVDQIELLVQDGQLVLRPLLHPRANWANQFQQMAAHGDDQLLDPELTPTQWEEDEWIW